MAGVTAGMAEMEMERKPAKPKGVEALIEIENPNAKPKAAKMMKAKVCSMTDLCMRVHFYLFRKQSWDESQKNELCACVFSTL